MQVTQLVNSNEVLSTKYGSHFITVEVRGLEVTIPSALPLITLPGYKPLPYSRLWRLVGSTEKQPVKFYSFSDRELYKLGKQLRGCS